MIPIFAVRSRKAAESASTSSGSPAAPPAGRGATATLSFIAFYCRGSCDCGAALVFLDLLKGEPKRPGERFLVHADQQPSRADPGADMDIDRVGHPRPAAVWRRFSMVC